MTYDDEAYLRYMEQLREAVFGLLENDITVGDIHKEVDNAAADAV